MASGANFVPGMEIMKRFNFQVEAGLVQQPKEIISNLMNINTFLETVMQNDSFINNHTFLNLYYI